MTAETQQFKNCREIIDISTYFAEEYFKDKKVVYVQL